VEIAAGFADFDVVAVLEGDGFLAVQREADVFVFVHAAAFERDFELAVVGDDDGADG